MSLKEPKPVLRFQKLIDAINFEFLCPDVKQTGGKPFVGQAYRFTASPVRTEVDFLPNHLYNHYRRTGKVERELEGLKSNESSCDNCGISLFQNKNGALMTWKSISPRIKNKLGYTHLSTGMVQKDAGISFNEKHNGHFTFYEYQGAELAGSFDICQEL